MTHSPATPSAPESWEPVSPADVVRPRPWWVAAAGPALLVVLLVLGGIIGGALGRSVGTTSPTPSSSPTPPYVMDPPIQVGDLVRGAVTESSGPAPENQRIVRADYSDGVNKVIFVMTWPEDDVSTYVADAGVEGANEVGRAGTLCGTSLDTSLPACGRISQGTGLLLLAVTEHATAELATQLAAFEDAVAAAG